VIAGAVMGGSGRNRAPPVKPPGEQRCPQCYRFRPYPSAFIGARGKPINWCTRCRKNYRGWDKKTPAEQAAVPRSGVPVRRELRVTFVPSSHNVKLGGIPASTTSRNTCPPSCSFYAAGCYALYGKTAYHWRNVPRDGVPWSQFLDHIRALPEGQLWRHNVAGDLPGDGEVLDGELLGELVEANRGRRGFTFTHKTGEEHHEFLQWANLEGFTVNLSADSLEAADALFQEGSPLTKAGPVAVVLPNDAPDRLKTPEGRRVVVCPAESEELTCAECGLCAIASRRVIVGFRAHGQAKRLVSELVQLRRKEAS
jgi:hypothetical protein